jgi:hypothetical protein
MASRTQTEWSRWPCQTKLDDLSAHAHTVSSLFLIYNSAPAGPQTLYRQACPNGRPPRRHPRLRPKPYRTPPPAPQTLQGILLCSKP